MVAGDSTCLVTTAARRLSPITCRGPCYGSCVWVRKSRLPGPGTVVITPAAGHPETAPPPEDADRAETPGFLGSSDGANGGDDRPEDRTDQLRGTPTATDQTPAGVGGMGTPIDLPGSWIAHGFSRSPTRRSGARPTTAAGPCCTRFSSFPSHGTSQWALAQVSAETGSLRPPNDVIQVDVLWRQGLARSLRTSGAVGGDASANTGDGFGLLRGDAVPRNTPDYTLKVDGDGTNRVGAVVIGSRRTVPRGGVGSEHPKRGPQT